MPVYMFQCAYKPEAWAALIKRPENRAEAARALLEKVGGRVICWYNCYGEYDVVAIVEAPDEITGVAAILSVIAPGHLKASKTTVLLPPEQTVEALRRAGELTFRAPGQ
jgi:uncharacterized protein with GYD domain